MVVILCNKGSDHTASTVSMSPCSMNEKELELPVVKLNEGDVPVGVSVSSTRWGPISLKSGHCRNALLEKKVKTTPSEIIIVSRLEESLTKDDPPCKIRKTQSLMSPNSMAKANLCSNRHGHNTRWSNSPMDTLITNEHGTMEPRKPIRRRGDSVDHEWEDVTTIESPLTLRRALSSVDARQQAWQQAPGFSNRDNVTFSRYMDTKNHNSKKLLNSERAEQDRRMITDKRNEQEEELLRKQLADLQSQAAVLATTNSFISRTRSSTSTSTSTTNSTSTSTNTEPILMINSRRSQNASRHQAMNLSAIEEDRNHDSIRLPGANMSWIEKDALLPGANSIAISSGSLHSKSSTASSTSMGLASVFDTSNHSNKSTSMASVFNKALTPDQQAKLMELQKSTSTSTSNFKSSHPRRREITDIPNAPPTLTSNIFSSIRSDTSEMSHHDDIISTGLIDLSGRFSTASDISSVSNRKSVRGKDRQQPPLSPKGRRKDVMQSLVQPKSTKNTMPFGYKAKSINGLFGSTKTPPSSTSRIQSMSTESARHVDNFHWEGTLLDTHSNDSIHSCLKKAPVQGEQLAKMKALLLGQTLPLSSSKTKKALLTRSHGSTPVLGALERSRSPRPDLAYKQPSRKSLSGNTLIPEPPSRWQPSPIPQNRRWNADQESTVPVNTNRLSGRRSVDVFAQSEYNRWSSHSLSTPTASPGVAMRKTLARRSPMRGRDPLAQSEHCPSRRSPSSHIDYHQGGSGQVSGLTGRPTCPKAIALNSLMTRREGEKHSLLKKTRGHDTWSQSEHGPSRKIPNNLAGIHRNSSALLSDLTGCPTSPEAVALSALIMRRDGDKRTSIKMTRGTGSMTRMSKPQASLGQLKRSRLSLANLSSESQEMESGGMNSTWNMVNDPSSKSKADTQLSSSVTHPKQNMFASIISSSRDKSISSHSSRIKSPSTSKRTMDLDCRLMSNMTRSKDFDNDQAVAVVDATTGSFAPRNKSDLRQILLGAAGTTGSVHRSRSINDIMKK